MEIVVVKEQVLETGDKYSGPLLNNLPHGVGHIKYTNGEEYEGDFVEG